MGVARSIAVIGVGSIKTITSMNNFTISVVAIGGSTSSMTTMTVGIVAVVITIANAIVVVVIAITINISIIVAITNITLVPRFMRIHIAMAGTVPVNAGLHILFLMTRGVHRRSLP